MFKTTKNFVLLSLTLAFSFAVFSPVYAIYDPADQKDCKPTSTKIVCLTRSIGQTPALQQQLIDALPLFKLILNSNVSVSIKEQLLTSIIAKIPQTLPSFPSEQTDFTYNGGTATLQDGKYSFNLGCNQIFGSYDQDGNNISFGIGASTMMACQVGLMDKDTQLINDLEKVDTVMFKDGNVILSGKGVELKLMGK